MVAYVALSRGLFGELVRALITLIVLVRGDMAKMCSVNEKFYFYFDLK